MNSPARSNYGHASRHAIGTGSRISEPDPAQFRAARAASPDPVAVRSAARVAVAQHRGKLPSLCSTPARATKSAPCCTICRKTSKSGLSRRHGRSSACSIPLLGTERPISCGRTGRETWVGSPSAMARSMPQEYGWDLQFEALVAEIVGEIHPDLRSAAGMLLRREGRQNRRFGVLVEEGADGGEVAPAAGRAESARVRDRGTAGAGMPAFCPSGGLSNCPLWTNSVLVAARRLYEREGFRLIEAQPHFSFGHELIGETWELAL